MGPAASVRSSDVELSSKVHMTLPQRPPRVSLARHMAGLALTCLLLGGCAGLAPTGNTGLTLPLLRGWFDGEEVFYVTTDVSHADVARAKGANFSPRLADALPAGPAQPGRRSSVDKVYAVTNFDQASIFASAPFPVGPASRDVAYSPLWQMVKVTWGDGRAQRILKSEEDVLEAAEKGQVRLEPTDVVLNCPIVHRGPKGGLPGVSFGWSTR